MKEQDEVLQIYVFLAIQILYFCSSVTFKPSVIFLYDRVFGVMYPFHYALITSWGIVASYFVACVFTAIFKCRPVSWYGTNPLGERASTKRNSTDGMSWRIS